MCLFYCAGYAFCVAVRKPTVSPISESVSSLSPTCSTSSTRWCKSVHRGAAVRFAQACSHSSPADFLVSRTLNPVRLRGRAPGHFDAHELLRMGHRPACVRSGRAGHRTVSMAGAFGVVRFMGQRALCRHLASYGAPGDLAVFSRLCCFLPCAVSRQGVSSQSDRLAARVDVVELGGDDEGVHRLGPLAAAVGAAEQP